MLLKENAKSFEIINKPSGKRGYKVYIFECSECKKDISAQDSHLKTHSGKCRSCCQKKRPYEHILNEIQKAGIKTNRNVALTYEEFIDIIKDKACHYCKKVLVFNKHSRDSNGFKVSKAYQLDRKDNNLGYTKENVVSCCWGCNRIKSDIYTYDEFMRLSPILKDIEESRNNNN